MRGAQRQQTCRYSGASATRRRERGACVGWENYSPVILPPGWPSTDSALGIVRLFRCWYVVKVMLQEILMSSPLTWSHAFLFTG